MTDKINAVYSALDRMTAELDEKDQEPQWPHECGQEISDTRCVSVMPSMRQWALKHGLRNIR